VLGFLALAPRVGLIASARRALDRAREAFAVVRRRDLDDAEKERATRAHAVAMLVSFAAIVGSAALATAVPLGIVWLAQLAGLVDFDAVLDALVSWQLLLGSVVAWLAFVWIRPARTKAP